MKKLWLYKISGSASDGQTWRVEGFLDCEFIATFDAAMRETFQRLTKGEAIFGQPGVGCQGPYDIDEVSIRQATDARTV